MATRKFLKSYRQYPDGWKSNGVKRRSIDIPYAPGYTGKHHLDPGRWTIYALCDKTGAVRYVGCTSDLQGRIISHTHRYDWFKDYIVIAALDCKREQAFQIERFWIERYRDLGEKLINKRPNLPTTDVVDGWR